MGRQDVLTNGLRVASRYRFGTAKTFTGQLMEGFAPPFVGIQVDANWNSRYDIAAVARMVEYSRISHKKGAGRSRRPGLLSLVQRLS